MQMSVASVMRNTSIQRLKLHHTQVISRCSAACEPYAEMECSTGIVGEACTRGQVFRARFKYSEQYDDAEADWCVSINMALQS